MSPLAYFTYVWANDKTTTDLPVCYNADGDGDA